MPTTSGMPPDSLALELVKSRDKFLAYVQRRIADPDLAEDILQESLLRAVQATPGLRREARLTAWFYRILQHAWPPCSPGWPHRQACSSSVGPLWGSARH